MAIHTTRWDSAEHLKTEEDIQMYLKAILEEAEDNPALIVHALGIIAQANDNLKAPSKPFRRRLS